MLRGVAGFTSKIFAGFAGYRGHTKIIQTHTTHTTHAHMMIHCCQLARSVFSLLQSFSQFCDLRGLVWTRQTSENSNMGCHSCEKKACNDDDDVNDDDNVDDDDDDDDDDGEDAVLATFSSQLL